MDDLELFDIQVHPDVADVLPLYAGLKDDDNSKALADLKDLADNGNKYACYVYGNYYILGRMPRFYIFSKQYEEGEVRKKAKVEINEKHGLSYLVKLLKISNGEVGEFQLEGIYDLFKLVEGEAEFFKTNDLECRPISNSDPMFPLFNSAKKIEALLGKLDHYEVYIDLAESSLESFKKTSAKEDMDKAMSYLYKILSDELFCRFSMHDMAQANYLLGMIYLHGNKFVEKDIEKGINLLVVSRKDEAFCELIDYYQNYGDKYTSAIRRCIGLIKDTELRKQKYEECKIPEPEPVSIQENLQKLISIKPKKKETSNLAFEFLEAEATPEPEKAKQVMQDEQVVEEVSEEKAAEREQEIADSFELILDDEEEASSTSSGDDDFVLPSEDEDDDFLSEMAGVDDEEDFPFPEDD